MIDNTTTEIELIKNGQRHIENTLIRLEQMVTKQSDIYPEYMIKQVEFNSRLDHLLQLIEKRNENWDSSIARIHNRIDLVEQKHERLQSRESELDKLNDFIEAFNAMKWKVVTGVGGILLLSIWQAVRVTPALQN